MKSKNDKPCPCCNNFPNRGVSVDAIIIEEGKILLIKRGMDPFKGYWALPGGYVDWDETVEEGVKREVLEETGLSVKSLKFVGLYSNPDRHSKQCITIAYVVDVQGNIKVGDDAVDFKWQAIESMPELAFDHGQIIKDFLNK